MEFFFILFPFIVLTILMVFANLEAQSPVFRVIAYLGVITVSSLLVLVGASVGSLLLVADPADVGMDPAMLEATGMLMRVIGVAGLLSFLPLLRPVRKLLARVMPIDPESTVHTTALVYAVYLLGLSLGQLPLLSDPAMVEGLDMQVSSSLIWAQAFGMIMLTLPGVGAFLRRTGPETLDRLGLKPLTLRHLLIAGGSILGLMLLQVGVSLAWQAIDPASFQQIGDANNLLLGEMTGLGAALTIGLAAALSEELLFRGALQPRFGLLITAVLFTLIHSQYGLSFATALILLIALVLGVLRSRTTLTVCILVHFGYNFLSVLFASSLP